MKPAARVAVSPVARSQPVRRQLLQALPQQQVPLDAEQVMQRQVLPVPCVALQAQPETPHTVLQVLRAMPHAMLRAPLETLHVVLQVQQVTPLAVLQALPATLHAVLQVQQKVPLAARRTQLAVPPVLPAAV